MSDSQATTAHVSYTDTWNLEEGPLAEARAKAAESASAAASATVGSLLQSLAASVGASAVVEVGTGTGVSGLWLLRGMRPEGILTTVDDDAEAQRLAKESFAAAGAASRARCIAGRATEVLPRLTDRAYDMAVIGGDPLDYEAHVGQAKRLLRPGGILVLLSALGAGQSVTDPSQRDAVTTSLRTVLDQVQQDEELTASLLPVDNGVLVAVMR